MSNPCWNCDAELTTDISVIGDSTWTTRLCPECGAQFTFADKGELDLGIVWPPGEGDLRVFTEEFIGHVDAIPPTPRSTDE